MGIVVTVYIRLFFVAFFIKHAYSSKSQFPSATIRCRSGVYKSVYILNDFFCIFHKGLDCAGGDDNVHCYTSDFRVQTPIYHCDNQRKNITVLCNTVKDCQDGSDELNCGDEVNVKNCTGEDKYLCKDGLRCLDLEYTCNGRCNCFDCSDENSNCTKNDFALLNECRHAYFVTANGPQCLCTSSSNTSSDTLCSQCPSYFRFDTERCDQRCIQFGGKSQCSCYDGFYAEERTNGLRCKPVNGNITVLFSQSTKITAWNKTTDQFSTTASGISNCTLLTAANNYVYFVTSSRSGTATISKASLHSGKRKKLIEIGFEINSIAVDYIANNVYFTGNGSLSVCTNDGRICKQLKCCGIGSVTLAPQSGFMFYTMQVQVHVESDERGFALMKSYMDGSNETTLTDEIYLGIGSIEMQESENSLFLLLNNRRGAQFQQILIKSRSEEVSVEDSSFILLEAEIINHTMNNLCMTMAAKHYVNFFKDYANLAEICWPTFEGFDKSSPLTDAHIYNEALQRCDQKPCNDSTCSGLCLLKPDTHSATHFLSYTCICDGFTPNGDNHWCSNEAAYGAHHRVFWIVAAIVSVVVILGVASGLVFKKKSWYWYYLTLRMWAQSSPDQEVVVVVGDEHQ